MTALPMFVPLGMWYNYFLAESIVYCHLPSQPLLCGIIQVNLRRVISGY